MSHPENSPSIKERIGEFFQPIRPYLETLNRHKRIILTTVALGIGVTVAEWAGINALGSQSEIERMPCLATLNLVAAIISIPLAIKYAQPPRLS